MDKSKKKRTALRSSFTKTLNIVKDELLNPASVIETGNLVDKLAKLNQLISDIKGLDNSILDYLLESNAEEMELDVEIEDSEKYSDEYITISRRVNEILHGSAQNPVVITENAESKSFYSMHKNKHYKLPKLNIPIYDGTLINYLSFWSQFKKIHEDKELEDCDKFQYLLQSVQTGTRAKELLASYPITSENYSKAISAFQDRFGKKELLVEVYVRELIQLIISNVRGNNKERLPLPDLYIKLEAHLRSLESMGLDANANATWLFPMVESSLAEDTLKAWQRSPLFYSEIDQENSRLSNLLEFLKREVEGEERSLLARRGFEGSRSKAYREITEAENKINKVVNTPTVAGLHTAKDLRCIFCDKSHDTRECFAARSMSLKEKVNKIKQKKCCLKCFKPFHMAKDCKYFVRCHICDKSHHVMLFPDLPIKGKVNSVEETKSEVVHTTVANQISSSSSEVALMILEVDITGDNGKKRVRALLDSGSMKSYILKSTAEEIGLKGFATERISHSLFGGAKTETKCHNKYLVKLNPPGRDSKRCYKFEFLDQNIICGNIPRLPKGPLLQELKRHRIWISDIGSRSPKIELLIGSDIYGKILTGRIRQLHNGLTAIQTKLGWTVCGQLGDSTTDCTTNCSATLATNLAIREFKISDLWKLETIGIMDPGETLTKAEEEEMAQEQFLNGLSRNEDGRYRVGLPWISDQKDIPSNRAVAEKRLFNATRRLKVLNQFENCNKVFQEWLEEGIIEEVPDNELKEKSHYLPHHPVIKPGSQTTKIGPGFDASCKVERSPSLNDCLVTGPNLIELIPSILLRFREKRIGVISVIRKAFLMIEIDKKDRNYLRFLWWKDKNRIQEFRHNRVVFGVRCSPFLLGAVLRQHLTGAPEELRYLSDKLLRSFYVDNCITSVDVMSELEDFVIKSKMLLAQANMDLRLLQFGPEREISPNSFTDKSLIEEDNKSIVSVLGLNWDRSDDSLMISNEFELKTTSPSKREILSITQGIFDPIGFLAPVLLPAKLLIREAWASKSNWDAPLPEEIQVNFKKWYEELRLLSNLKIPRRIGFGNRCDWTIHVFCDASQNSYATVIFIRCEVHGDAEVQLIGARSRLSPLKKMTIPRLELLACVLGARLSQFLLEALDFAPDTLFFWTDSSTGLAWIQRNDQWGTFVREICKVTDPKRWFFVPGSHNPADLPSRGCTPRQFLESRWWEGPDWLRKSRHAWPKSEANTDENVVDAEKRKSSTITLNSRTEYPQWFENISKFSRIIRILAWVRRYLRKSQKKCNVKGKSLSGDELQEAENTHWRIVQKESFPDTAKSSIKGLMVIVDEAGVIRVKTNILERDDELSFRYPVLLPSKHKVVISLVTEYHLNNCHAGVLVLATKLREKYWIMASKRVIRNIITKCVRCKRFCAKAQNTPPIHLPLDRVRDAAAFEITGVDLCGPLFLKEKKKTWVVLYTCAVYRAVHLEAVTSLSTEAFLQSFRRFIARRGRPSTVYSDNGTNFAGTNNLLKDLDWEKIQTSDNISPIRWKFIPPTAAWWGGWWERLIRTVKTLLVRVLGRASVNFEELYTVLCDIEATINCRPLTYLSDGPEGVSPLTPSMFLHDRAACGVADIDAVDSEKLQLRHKYCQQLREQLRIRFRSEYLGQLVQRSNGKDSNLQVDDVVLVGQDNQKRIYWPMARVQKIFPSRDGKSRVAELKTSNGTLIRPIRKLYPLEVSTADDPVIKRSRSGRVLRAPARLNA